MENNINGRTEEERFMTEEALSNKEETMESVAADATLQDELDGIVDAEAGESLQEDKAEGIEETDGTEDAAEAEKGEVKEGHDTAELLKTIDELEKKLAEKEQEKEDLNNRLLRLQADFSNYRKRNEKEFAKLKSTIVAGLIEELLPVLDNFDRALAQEGSGEDFRKGIEMIHRQLMDFLEKQGVENIEAVGKEFDHNYHNAVQQVKTDEYESGIVVEELLKGYILNNDIVIRPSMVKVAK